MVGLGDADSVGLRQFVCSQGRTVRDSEGRRVSLGFSLGFQQLAGLPGLELGRGKGDRDRRVLGSEERDGISSAAA